MLFSVRFFLIADTDMKKKIVQFGCAIFGATAGAVLFVLLWPSIDRFFYEFFGMVLQSVGSHTPSLSLLYVFIPGIAAVCTAACNKIFYRESGAAFFLRILVSCMLIGGTLSLLAVHIASGAVAAVLVAGCMGLAAVLGGTVNRLPGRQA